MCHDGGFKCTTGNIACINSRLLCDEFQHCSDDSDEESCGKYCKPKKYIQCLSDFVIIGFCDLLPFVTSLPIANFTVTAIVTVTTVAFCD